MPSPLANRTYRHLFSAQVIAYVGIAPVVGGSRIVFRAVSYSSASIWRGRVRKYAGSDELGL